MMLGRIEELDCGLLLLLWLLEVPSLSLQLICLSLLSCLDSVGRSRPLTIHQCYSSEMVTAAQCASLQEKDDGLCVFRLPHTSPEATALAG